VGERRSRMQMDTRIGRTKPKRSQRGAVVVEAALLLPLLVLLCFGAIEYGFAYKDELKITTAARTGARVGTADKNTAGTSVNADDDYQVLQAVYAALGPLAPKVNYVSIYNAGTNANGGPPAGCSGVGAATVANECDVYAYSDLSSSAATINAYMAAHWPASQRFLALDASNGQEPTFLGVYIETTHNYLTGIFGSSRKLSESAVFRYEPIGNTSHGNFLAPETTTTTTTPAPTTSTSTPPSTTTPPTTTPPTTAGGGGTTTAPPTTAGPTTTVGGPTTTVHTTTTGHTTTTVHTTTTAHGGGTTTTAAAPTTTIIVIIYPSSLIVLPA